ncbi:hypothetical protein HY030_00165 [Candidatus Gottesmanbacteria bacterium]|nr:hypothetical protein [Candidatus Gottesmanbacteria bacterium]
MNKSEDVQLLLTERPNIAEVIQNFPDGAFIYFYPDRTIFPRLHKKLQTALPHHFIILTPRTGQLSFPADMGTQIDDHFNCYSTDKSYIIRTFGVNVVSPDHPITDYLPDLITPGINCYIEEGGTMVPVGGTNALLISLLKPGEDTYLDSNGYNTIATRKMDEGLIEFKKTARIPKEDKWLYGDPRFTGHIDLVLTGFANSHGELRGGERVYYIDNILYPRN